MMTDRVRIMVAALSLAWAGAALAQGIYWEGKTTGVGDEGRTTQNYAMPKMMKIVNSDGHVMILRTDQEKIITVDPKKHSYREMTFSELEAAAQSMQGQMEAARAQIEKQMKDMPPEQRQMMEKMLPKKPDAAQPSSVIVKNTGETRNIGGYACTKYVATEAGKTVLVAWTTKDVKGFEALRSDWLAYQKRLAGTNRTFGGGVAEAYTKVEGFPMETEMGNIKTEVTKIESRTTPASEFEVPAGYAKESVSFPKPAQE